MSWKAALSRNVRELRFCCCHAAESSAAVRSFYRNNYAELKMLNPNFPLLLREGKGIEPYMMATYDFGKEDMVSLESLTEEQIGEKVKAAVAKGETMPVAPVQPSFRGLPAEVVDA